MDHKESNRRLGALKSTSSLVEITSKSGDHAAHPPFPKGASTGTYAPIRSSDGSSPSTFSCQLPRTSPEYSTASSNPSRSAFLSRQASFDQGGEGRLSSTQVKQRLKAYLLNRRRGRVLANRHWRADGKVCSSSQNPFTESDFDESLEHSGSESCQQGMCHIGDHWHSADSPGFSEWDFGMLDFLHFSICFSLFNFFLSLKILFLSGRIVTTISTVGKVTLTARRNVGSLFTNKISVNQVSTFVRFQNISV
ncbi:unnamed protein product [Trichobilharzia regenti]|nr:unnamed protein product [Trichobilharzia regenti]